MPRRFARLALALFTATTLVAAGGLTVLALGGGDWAVNLVLRKINPWPGASLRAGDVMGNLLTAPRLCGLSLTRADGEVMLRADSAAVRYDLRRLLGGDITLAEIRVYGADLVLRQRDDGRWDLPARRTRPPGSPPKQPDVIRLERVQIVDDREHVMEVVVEDKQLSLAIGKKGQNVRLAAKLTGWRIDIRSDAGVATAAAAHDGSDDEGAHDSADGHDTGQLDADAAAEEATADAEATT